MAASAVNGEVEIAYDVQGAGEPLVLLHGFTSNRDSWRALGYVDALRRLGLRTILIDARGHGASGKPRDPARYGLAERAGDVVAVLDSLGIERAHLVGYSMGGWIGLGVARHFPDRLQSLAVLGAHPLAQSMEAYRRGIADGLEGWVAILEKMLGRALPGAMRAQLLANDLAALRAAVADDRADISDTLTGLGRPVLFAVGSDDPIYDTVAAAATKLQASFARLPDLNHVGTLFHSEVTLRPLTDFLERVAAGA